MLADADFWATLPAADIERAKRWYAEKLGLTPVKETHAWITYRCGSSILQLYPTASGGHARHTLGGWVVDDLEATVAELRGRGVEFEEYDVPGLKTVEGIAELGGVERAAWFRDSEGNILAISTFLTDPLG
jgi:catechol 2,3-dioxygenase-like lactoylglutathione lyase family enzyme